MHADMGAVLGQGVVAVQARDVLLPALIAGHQDVGGLGPSSRIVAGLAGFELFHDLAGDAEHRV